MTDKQANAVQGFQVRMAALGRPVQVVKEATEQDPVVHLRQKTTREKAPAGSKDIAAMNRIAAGRVGLDSTLLGWRWVFNHPGVDAQILASALGCSKSTAQQTLQALYGANLVTRHLGPERNNRRGRRTYVYSASVPEDVANKEIQRVFAYASQPKRKTKPATPKVPDMTLQSVRVKTPAQVAAPVQALSDSPRIPYRLQGATLEELLEIKLFLQSILKD